VRALLLALLALSSAALAGPRKAPEVVRQAVLAAEQKVPVKAEVVFASTSPGTVEAGLEGMKATLAPKMKYLTLKRLSTQTLVVEAKPLVLKLVEGREAELKLEALKDGVATLRVKVPPTDATYTLAKAKALYLQAGEHDGGDLWLVLGQPK
jgi:hypothetical protein